MNIDYVNTWYWCVYVCVWEGAHKIMFLQYYSRFDMFKEMIFSFALINNSRAFITYYLDCTEFGLCVAAHGWKPVLTQYAGLLPYPTLLSHLELPKPTCQQNCQCSPQGI